MISPEGVLIAFWLLLPAFVPNSAAVVAGGGQPIDNGYTWNGQRVLGDGKTWRGLAAGALAGMATAGVANLVRPTLVDTLSLSLPQFSLTAAAALAVGAMLGDIGASFLKRRTGRARGASFPLVDQLDFIVGAGVCALLVAPTWILQYVTLPLVLVILIGTPLVHRGVNILAYSAGIKNEPW